MQVLWDFTEANLSKKGAEIDSAPFLHDAPSPDKQDKCVDEVIFC